MSTPGETNDRDVLILGAGAAGLFAAIRAAERGARVTVLEKNRRAGVKILISGGTRCNITNARGLRSLRGVSGPIDPAYDFREARGARSIQEAFGAGGPFLGPALRAFGVDRTVAFFEGMNLPLKVEGNGKLFPASDKALDVVNVLLARLHAVGAELRCNAPALSISASDTGFEVVTPGGTVTAPRLIVAVGGLSYPGCGTTGDGFAFAREFGHTIVPTRPALVPLRVVPPWVPTLKGLTIPDAEAAVKTPGGATLLKRREAVLFAHFGLTGPAILDVSRAVARHEGPDALDLVLDLLPGRKPESLDQSLQEGSRSGRRPVVGLLPPEVPRRLADEVLRAAEVPPGRLGPDLSRDERKRLVAACKGLKLPVAGTLGFGKAEVTSGGVALDEVKPETLESLRRPGLHFAGEVLDLDGLIGGYNFQAAWSTGWLAGDAAANTALAAQAPGLGCSQS